MTIILFKDVSKKYDTTDNIIKDFSLEIKAKEFIVVLGPSGSGKSTVLRMLAGLEEVTSGQVFIRGENQTKLAPKDRKLAIVFQNYALYPHMTVEKNLSFGLRMRREAKSTIQERVAKAAEILDLSPYLKKYPRQLSGGQMQRVALGRAIVRESDIFLMDEPLSNLDSKLRAVMREEIVKLHKRLEATTLYVTHDQTEAMTMADRIVIMKQGKIQQVGTPKEIFSRPQNTFVASFIGNPAMNLLTLEKKEKAYQLGNLALSLAGNQELVMGVRPKDIKIDADGILTFKVDYIEDLGNVQYLHGNLNGQKIIVEDDVAKEHFVGEALSISFNKQKVLFYEQKSGELLEELQWK